MSQPIFIPIRQFRYCLFIALFVTVFIFCRGARGQAGSLSSQSPTDDLRDLFVQMAKELQGRLHYGVDADCQNFSIEFERLCGNRGLNCPKVGIVCRDKLNVISTGHAVNAVSIDGENCLVEPQSGEVFRPCAPSVSQIPIEAYCKILNQPPDCNCQRFQDITGLIRIDPLTGPYPGFYWWSFFLPDLITGHSDPSGCSNQINWRPGKFLNCKNCCGEGHYNLHSAPAECKFCATGKQFGEC